MGASSPPAPRRRTPHSTAAAGFRAGILLALLFGALITQGCDSVTDPEQDPAPVGPLVRPSGLTLGVGESATLQPPEATGSAPVEWSVENPAIATIDASGVVTALRDGQTGLRAVSDDAVARGLLTVVAPAAVPVSAIHAVEDPYPPAHLPKDLHDVWGAEEDDVFAVGEAGTLIHWNGSRWTRADIPTESSLHSVWGTTGDNVYAAADDSLFHFDGSSWRPVASHAVALADLAGDPAATLFGVGAHLVLRYDGSIWETLTSDSYGYYWPPTYSGVWAASSADVWVVGRGAPDSNQFFLPVMLHYDGSSVVEVDLPGVERGASGHWWLAGVHGTSPDDIVAVGGDSRALNPPHEPLPYALHFDGGEWSRMSLAEELFGTFSDVWGSATGQWFAVGVERQRSGSGQRGIIARYDGSVWREVGPDGVFRGISKIWGARESAMFAVGEDGLAMHYDGSTWTQVETPAGPRPAPLPEADLWGAAPDDIFAVGSGGNIMHYDGADWSALESGTEVDLHGVWGASSHEVFAVGDGGTILRWNGDAWSTEATGGPALLDVWGVTGDRVYAVGEAGRVLRYDGAGWEAIDVGAEGDLRAVWGTAPDHILVAGEGAALFLYDGTNWDDVSPGGAADYNAIWGTGPDHIYLVAEEIRDDGFASGFLLLNEGSAWDRIPGIHGTPYYDVWGSGPDDVYAAGADGWIMRFDGTGWLHLRRFTGEEVQAVWGTAAGPVYFLADDPPAIMAGVR